MGLFAECVSTVRKLSLKLRLVLFPCELSIWTLRALAAIFIVGSRWVRLRPTAGGSPHAAIGRLRFLISLLGNVSVPSVVVGSLSCGSFRYRLSSPTASPRRRGVTSLVRGGYAALGGSPASVSLGDASLSLCVALLSSVELVLDSALWPVFVA
jgi:hypothetical protein